MRIQNRMLKIRVLFLICGIVPAASAQHYTPPQIRALRCLNKDWKFIKQDVGVAQGTGVTDPSGMSKINLPHSFDIPYWRVGGAAAPALGWYRKHITIDQSVVDAKKRVFIEFEAAFQIANVYVNGLFAGQHKGGYTGFSLDITQYVKAGDNIVAVFLDARWSDTIAPLSGEHVFIGGIYRNVTLVITDPLHVTWYGTFVSTPQAASGSGTVKVKTEIKNDGSAAASCKVKTVIVDATGAQVTSSESPAQNIAAGATMTFVQTSDAIANPHLWSPASPYLYKVYTEVYNGTAAVDNFESPLGFRTIKWTMTNGFELNGQRLWLQGANVHQDHAGWGDASTNSGSFRDVKLVKDCGMNFIRGSHYPHAPAFSDACDKLGVCLWSEAPFWALGISSANGWGSGACVNNAPFKKSLLDQIREMIRIHRNHPSIIAWSMGNELWFWGSCSADTVVACLARMVAVAHAEDSTRPAGVGGVQLNTAQLSKPCDIVGFNGGLTTGNAGIPSMVSEYGSCTDGGDAYEACWGDNITTPPTPAQNAWRAGVSLWCAFDHGSNINTGLMGMINNARVPQRRWYFYRNLYQGIAPPAWPAAGTAAKLKLTKDRDTITDDGTTDAQILVEVQDASGKWLSNSPDITFTDKSELGSFPTGSTITFKGGEREKGVRNGQAAIEFRSYKAGTVTIEATSGSLPPASVTITVLPTDDTPVRMSCIPVSHAADCPQEMVVTGFGNRITLPGNLSGKKVAVSLFDMRGRLIGQVSPIHSRVIIRRNAAEGVVIARAKVVR
jgi:beta-galactosidase